MDDRQRCMAFISWFEDTLNARPGMLGSVADISAMFFVIDNFNSLLSFGETLPRELSWNEFLFDRKLIRDLTPIPVQDDWSFDRFVELRHQYLKWVAERRPQSK